MSDNQSITPDRDIRPESLAAELTSVAYRLMLRRGAKGASLELELCRQEQWYSICSKNEGAKVSWLELELCLWRRLTETVERWSGQRPFAPSPWELELWQAGLLADLTADASAIALNSGIKGSFLTVELGLYLVFHRVLYRHRRVHSS